MPEQTDITRIDLPLWQGVHRLLDTFIVARDEDDFVIAYAPDAREGAAWVYMALEGRGYRVRITPMSPLHDPDFEARLRNIVPRTRADPGRCVLIILEMDTMSHNDVVRRCFLEYESYQYQVVRTINSNRDLFTIGLQVPPNVLSALNASLMYAMAGSKHIEVSTPAGTLLSIELEQNLYKWISNRGIPQPRKFMVLPAGEVATYPANISGRLVADFAINVNSVFSGDARLDSSPVTVEIQDGLAVDIQCENRKMLAFLEQAFTRRNSRRVGELGFGTNSAVIKPVSENSHLNERTPGIHIGFGQHNQTDELTGYSCDIHIDLIAKGGMVRCLDTSIEFDLTRVVPTDRPHPPVEMSEDVFSGDDCCGLGAASMN